MPRLAKARSEEEIRAITEPGYYAVGRLPGLTLQVTKGGSRSWLLRISINGRRVELGLGKYPDVSLDEAYEKAVRRRKIALLDNSLSINAKHAHSLSSPNKSIDSEDIETSSPGTATNPASDISPSRTRVGDAAVVFGSHGSKEPMQALEENGSSFSRELRESAQMPSPTASPLGIVPNITNTRNGPAPLAIRTSTFRVCVEEYINAHMADPIDSDRARNWKAMLEFHAFPVIGSKLVCEIKAGDILEILIPKWETQKETMHRLRRRMSVIFDWALGAPHEDVNNPAEWRDLLSSQLTPRIKPKSVQMRRGISYGRMPAFMADLQERVGFGKLCLEFCIFTMCKAGPARLADWGQINLQTGFWRVAAHLGKNGRRLRNIPLSTHAVELLKSLPTRAEEGFIFGDSGKAISDRALLAVLRRMNVNAVPDGFRNTFADWCQSEKKYTRRFCDTILGRNGHDIKLPDDQDDNLYKEWRQALQDWGDFLMTKCSRSI